jgi:hypothetical protein
MAGDPSSQTATIAGNGVDTPATITINVPGMGINHQFITSADQIALDGSVTFNGAPIFSIGGSNIAMFKDGAGGVLVTDNTGQLSSSNYGIWSHSDANGNVTAVGAFATGTETLATNLPTTGSATYAGSAVATGTTGGQNVNWAGTFNGAVDFQARTATVGLNLQASDGTSGALNLSSGPLGMTGARYAGAISGSNVSGTTIGALYGPAGNEMAGVFNVAGSGTTAIGAYGGAQQPVAH